MPFEEWIYGKPPEDVEFVRINGNRVIRVEIAKMGETPVIFTKDEVAGMMRTDGTPLMTAATHTRASMRRAMCSAIPTRRRRPLRPACANPARQLPSDDPNANQPGQKNVGVMKPVQFPKPSPPRSPALEPRRQFPTPSRPPRTRIRFDTATRQRRPPRPAPAEQPLAANSSQPAPANPPSACRPQPPSRTEPASALSCKLEPASPAPSRQFHCDERQHRPRR